MTERIRNLTSLITAVAALATASTALYKAVDKTLERKSYETSRRAIEALRDENDDLRKAIDKLVDKNDQLKIDTAITISTHPSSVASGSVQPIEAVARPVMPTWSSL